MRVWSMLAWSLAPVSSTLGFTYMTHQQQALIRYWLMGTVIVAAILWLSDHKNFRLMVLPLFLAVGLFDRFMRPPTPEGAPTPLAIIERSRFWRTFFIAYGAGAVVLAVVSITIHDFGSWLGHNRWLIVPLIIFPIIGPVFRSQYEIWRAYGNQSP